MGRPYEPWEDAFIKQHYSTSGAKFIAAHLPNRSMDAIRSRAAFLGVRGKVLVWTYREDDVLRDCHPDMKKAAKMLPHRSPIAILRRSRFLRLGRQKRWDEAQRSLVAKATQHCTDAEIAAILGRSIGAVITQRNGLRCLRVPRKESTVPVVRDVVSEAKWRRVKLTTLTKALKCARIDPADDHTRLNFSAVAKVTEAFGGHLYAEWDD